MIVKMKKILLLCQAARRQEALTALRNLGVLHLALARDIKSDDLDQARGNVRACEQAIRVLTQHVDPSDVSDIPGSSPETMIRETLALDDKRKRLEDQLQTLKQEWQPWAGFGAFDPAAIRSFEKRGLAVRLFRSREAQPPNPPPGFKLVPFKWTPKGGMYVLVGFGEPETNPEAEPLPLPTRALSEIRQETAAVEEQLAQTVAGLRALAAYREVLATELGHQRDAVRFAEAQATMAERGDLAWLSGYSPADKTEAVRQAAADNGWGLLIKEPDTADAPPTLIRNPFWVKPIQSVMDMIGILPGYREVDISAVFLLFFSVFFAIIVGDAGYGALFLLLTLGARKKFPAAPKPAIHLLMILSVSTIAWGLMTGNIFGMTVFPSFLAPLQVRWLMNNDNLMLLCFLMGAIHLTIAHGWNVVRMINSPQALAQAGWIAVTWVMFFTARSMILGSTFPTFAYALLVGGLLAIVLFMTPRRQLKTEWTSHVILPLTVISNFVDVVSYVRLFAVGSASLAVAQAFNNMAIGDDMGILRSLVAALILFAGHALNIVLCGLGVLVHGVRLNTLEFSGHIGMQWTGEPYHPFVAERHEKTKADGAR